MAFPMSPQKRAGRLVGVLLLLHLIGGLILPYVLLDRVLPPPGFLERAAPESALLRAAVALFILAAALVLAIAAAVAPVFRAHAERLATAFVAVAAANLALQLVESGTLMTMLPLSREFAGASDAAALRAVGAAVGSFRTWAHYTQLLTVVGWLFLLYLVLWRAALVPRLLAAAGMVTTVLQIIGVSVRALLGYPPIIEMAMPLAPVHLTLALWLIVNGMRTVPVAAAPGGRTAAVAHAAAQGG